MCQIAIGLLSMGVHPIIVYPEEFQDTMLRPPGCTGCPVADFDPSYVMGSIFQLCDRGASEFYFFISDCISQDDSPALSINFHELSTFLRIHYPSDVYRFTELPQSRADGPGVTHWANLAEFAPLTGTTCWQVECPADLDLSARLPQSPTRVVVTTAPPLVEECLIEGWALSQQRPTIDPEGVSDRAYLNDASNHARESSSYELESSLGLGGVTEPIVDRGRALKIPIAVERQRIRIIRSLVPAPFIVQLLCLALGDGAHLTRRAPSSEARAEWRSVPSAEPLANALRQECPYLADLVARGLPCETDLGPG